MAVSAREILGWVAALVPLAAVIGTGFAAAVIWIGEQRWTTGAEVEEKLLEFLADQYEDSLDRLGHQWVLIQQARESNDSMRTLRLLEQMNRMELVQRQRAYDQLQKALELNRAGQNAGDTTAAPESPL